uniref:Uncharacterized protein n=1 Tax=Anguilla anguilla TaxID=7936 RepID=A0A0E9QU94_ANGAN
MTINTPTHGRGWCICILALYCIVLYYIVLYFYYTIIIFFNLVIVLDCMLTPCTKANSLYIVPGK